MEMLRGESRRRVYILKVFILGFIIGLSLGVCIGFIWGTTEMNSMLDKMQMEPRQMKAIPF